MTAAAGPEQTGDDQLWRQTLERLKSTIPAGAPAPHRAWNDIYNDGIRAGLDMAMDALAAMAATLQASGSPLAARPVAYRSYETKFGGHWEYHEAEALPAGSWLQHRPDAEPLYTPQPRELRAGRSAPQERPT